MPNINNVSGKDLDKKMLKLKYSVSRDEVETLDIAILRKKILKKIAKNKPFDELESKLDELKERQFIKRTGMGTKEYEQKFEEEKFLRETVTIRECLCGGCHKTFDSDRFHPKCSHCKEQQYYPLERDTSSNIIGKVVESIFRSPERELIMFTDKTFHINSISGFY